MTKTAQLTALLAILCLTPAAAIADSATVDTAAANAIGTPPSDVGAARVQRGLPVSAVIHSVPSDSHISCPPVLSPKRIAWVTVKDAKGQPLANVSVIVNGQPFDTSSSGRAFFPVPNSGALSLTLRDTAGNDTDRRDFVLLPDGLFALPTAATVVQKLVPMTPPPGTQAPPELYYAPSIIQPGSTVVVLGSEFDGTPGSDRLVIDGVECEVLAGSNSSLLAYVPLRLQPGPIKQIYVATPHGDTRSLETDVAQVQIDVPADAQTKQDEFVARVSAVGTNLPALIEINNSNPDAVAINTPEGQPIDDKTILVLPGGDDNAQQLTLLHKSKRRFALSARIIPEVPQFSPSPEAVTKSSRSNTLLQALDYATIVRLKRRLIAVENRQSETRLLSPASGQSPAQFDKMTSQLRALSMRHAALGSMLSARHAALLAAGGTETQFDKAIDDAAGGAYYVLESQVKKFYVVPEVAVVTQMNGGAAVPKRTRIINLPEPKFKLWPPVDNLLQLKPAISNVVPVQPASAVAAVTDNKNATQDGNSEEAKTAVKNSADKAAVKAKNGGSASTDKKIVGKNKAVARTSINHRRHRRRHKS